jgi:hypothetical protein
MVARFAKVAGVWCGIFAFFVHSLFTLFVPLFILVSFDGRRAATYSRVSANFSVLRYPAKWFWDRGVDSHGIYGFIGAIGNSLVWGTALAVFAYLVLRGSGLLKAKP